MVEELTLAVALSQNNRTHKNLNGAYIAQRYLALMTQVNPVRMSQSKRARTLPVVWYRPR
jgi:hypothetical protein